MALTQISTAGVKDDAVTAGKIPADAIGSSEIAANAVGSSELADNAVDTNAIADDAVTGAKISSATTITAGTGNNVGVLDGADNTYRIYAGHATPASAPFRVEQDGTVIIETSTSSSTSRLVLEDDTIKIYDKIIRK